MKKISVIVPVYKVEEYLDECIQSIVSQTYENLEIILVDDGGADNCPKICEEWKSKDDRIVVIHSTKNEGLSASRNKALDLATGDLIAFVDSDDWLEITAYQEMVAFLERNDLDACFCCANKVYPNKVVTGEFEFYPNETILAPEIVVKDLLEDVIGGQVWLRICRKELWRNVRFPIGRLYEDLAISYLPFLNATKNIGFLTKSLYNYRYNNLGISLTKNPKKIYHIFLGFLEHYEFSKEKFKQSKDKCLECATVHALQVVNEYIRRKDEEFKNSYLHAKKFLFDLQEEILDCCTFKLKNKIKTRLYYNHKKLYNFIVKLKKG